MAGVDRGPGVLAKEQAYDATPETGELYVPFSDGSFPRSITFEEVGASDGQHKALRIFMYDKARNMVVSFRPEDGPDADHDFYLGTGPGPAPVPASGLQRGFDVGYPFLGDGTPRDLPGVIRALSATFIAPYIGGYDYIGNWTAELARELQPLLPADGGFCPVYVPRQATAYSQEQGMADAADALRLADDVWGFDVGGNIMFDIEAGTWYQNPAGVIQYMRGVEYAMADSPKWGPGFYGPRPGCDAMKEDPACATWLAGWDGFADVEGYDVHQYTGATTVSGVQVDLDICVLRAPAFLFARFA